MRLDKKIFLKSIGVGATLLDFMSIGLGIAYAIAPSYIPVWDVFDVLRPGEKPQPRAAHIKKRDIFQSLTDIKTPCKGKT